MPQHLASPTTGSSSADEPRLADATPRPGATSRTTGRSPRRPHELHRLTRPIVTAPTLRESLAALCDALVRVTGVEDIAVTVEAEGTTPVLLASSRTASRAVSLQRELGEGPHLVAAATGESCVLPDLVSEPRWPRARARLATLGLGAALAVPLAFNGRRLGSVSCYRFTPWRVGDLDVDVARLLADVTAADLAYRHRPALGAAVAAR
jgi:GAF domain-containing protein